MRPLLAALFAVATVGCATGTPVGARFALDEAGYRPFIRGGVARPTPSVDAPAGAPLLVRAGARDRVVELARTQVGQRKIVLGGKSWPEDCTGLVKGVFAQEGLDLFSQGKPGDNGVSAIWRFAETNGRTYQGGHPVPGDLVFFKETYDRNRDGAANDGLTHVGIVDTQDSDGTVTIIHRVARGVVRYRMNLSRPDQATSADGKVLNDWLRPAAGGNRPQLTAQLFAGYATLLPIEPRLAQR